MSDSETASNADRSNPQVSVSDANTLVRNSEAKLLDVRGFGEFATGHAQSAICIPLDDVARRAGELPTDRPVLVMCRSGHRSAMAVDRLRALGMDNITDIAGGFLAWSKAGLPIEKQANTMPLERQVRIVAGALVLCFSLAGFLMSSVFFYGAMLIGFMLALTGALGICPMISVLQLLPWNRVKA